MNTRGLRPHEDAFGRALLDRLSGLPTSEIVERDDGFIEVVDMDDSVYFAEFPEWDPIDRRAMKYVAGRVLDLGSGAGRVALHLQNQGHAVLAVDLSPLAIKVCRQRGVKRARVMRIADVGPGLGKFDTIVMLGRNFGLVGTPSKAKTLLRRLARITPGNGRIVAESVDPYAESDEDHILYLGRNRRRGLLGGQLKLRIRYRSLATPWFEFLLVSPDEMEQVIDGTGWKIARILESKNPDYVAILERSDWDLIERRTK